jgi:hypothetical protein
MKNNKLIAEFMGANPFRESVNEDVLSYEMYGLVENIEDGLDEKHFFLPSEMKYHTSWDWLMPVIDKIESDGRYGVEILKYGTTIRASKTEIVADISFGDKIDHTYNAVVKFIKQSI